MPLNISALCSSKVATPLKSLNILNMIVPTFLFEVEYQKYVFVL
jgi:hypothetical protein